MDNLVGNKIRFEFKRPGQKLLDMVLYVLAQLRVMGEKGPIDYIWVQNEDGSIGPVNVKFIYSDSIEIIEPIKDFKKFNMDGYYVTPAENGVFDPHFLMFEKVEDAKTLKRLPPQAVKMSSVVMFDTPAPAPSAPFAAPAQP